MAAFSHKIGIVTKEPAESEFCLELIIDENLKRKSLI